MKILHTSDWHLGQKFLNNTRLYENEQALNWLLQVIDNEQIDVLIVAGDVFDTMNPPNYARTLYYNFLTKLEKTHCRHTIIIGGNHDFLLEKNPSIFRALLEEYPGLIYLENEATTIEGIKIWGSPVTPFFFNWAFNEQRGEAIRKFWKAIPDDVDILVTHGPPLGYGDRTERGELVGCKDLLDIVKEIKPKYHTFGHIHEGYGLYENDATTFINASIVNVRYETVNQPVSIDFIKNY